MSALVRVAILRNTQVLCLYYQIKLSPLKTAIFFLKSFVIGVVSIYSELQAQTVYESLKCNRKVCHKYKIFDHMSPCCGEQTFFPVCQVMSINPFNAGVFCGFS